MIKLPLFLALILLSSCAPLLYHNSNQQSQTIQRPLSQEERCEICFKNRNYSNAGCYRVVAECYENGSGGFVKNQKLADENYWEGAINGCSECEIIQAKRGKEMPEYYAMRRRLSRRIAAEQAANDIANMQNRRNSDSEFLNSAIGNMINNSVQNQQILRQQQQQNKPVTCSSHPKLGGGMEVYCH